MWQKTKLTYPLIGLVIFILNLPIKPSVDAVSSRYDFKNNPNDWFGGLTPIVYGSIPGGDQWWFYLLSFMQLFLFTVGFSLLFHKITSVLSITLYLMGGLFAIWIVRDSLLVTLSILGIGIIYRSWIQFAGMTKVSFIFIGFILLTLGLSIRPFLGIALLPLILALAKKRYLSNFLATAAAIFLVLAPFVENSLLANSQNQKNTMPEQQMILLDLAQLACWSSNDEVNQRAENILASYVRDFSSNELCLYLRPYNWQYLVNPMDSSSRAPLSKFNAQDERGFSELTRDYIKLAIARPDELIQIKMRNFVELFFVNGQFNGLSDHPTFISKLLHLGDRLHLNSWAFIAFVYLVNIRVEGFRRIRFQKTTHSEISAALILSSLISVLLISVFYVAAIGRYTVFSSLLLLFGLLYRTKNPKLTKDKLY